MRFSFFLIPFFLSLFLSFLFRLLALHLGFLDKPSRQSKIHSKPVPYLGGMAIFSSLLLSLALFKSSIPYYLLVSLVAFLLLGTIDDLLDIRALYRLPLQVLLAIVIIYTGWRFSFIPIRYLNSLLVTLFLLGVINSLNCWDVSDGSAIASFLAIALSLTSYCDFLNKDIPYITPLIGAIVGWLPHNIHPAKMFLGDGGAYFLGISLSASALFLSYQLPPLQGLIPLFPFILPCLDFIAVHYRRYKGGIRDLRDLLTSTGKDHLPHRLLAKTNSPNLTAVILFLLILITSFLPLLFPPRFIFIPFLLSIMIYFILDKYLPPSL